MIATWLPLPEPWDRFEVTSDGQVRTRKSGIPCARQIRTAGVFIGIGSDWVDVSFMVLTAWFGPRMGSELPVHRDGNRLNNRIANLRWSFAREEPVVPSGRGRFIRFVPRKKREEAA